MCVYSMILDHYRDKWAPYVPEPYRAPPSPGWPTALPTPLPAPAPITPAEIDEFRRLLERAREYDRRNQEPDCEIQEKKDALKRIADALGVDVSFVESTPPLPGASLAAPPLT